MTFSDPIKDRADLCHPGLFNPNASFPFWFIIFLGHLIFTQKDIK